ncbi:MAG: response regulator transcription factor [Bacteroidia bacterium]|nr:response regulator transcription factor [Bacteroidia bacterium]
MINTLIIDDEANSVELILNLISLSKMEIKVVATANSVETGYTAILQHKPDLIFLDVQMQDGTGFDLLNRLNGIALKVIFITAHEQFAINAFKYSAIDYLLKPISPVDFMTALKKAKETINNEDIRIQLTALSHNVSEPLNKNKKIVLKTLDKIYAVQSSEIIRMESEGSYTTIFLSDGKKVIVSKLIKDFDEMLSENGFMRVHQSHLINMNYLFCFEKSDHMIIMKDESSVPVSTRKKEQVMKLIQDL